MKNKIIIDDYFKEKLSPLGTPDATEDWKAMTEMLDSSSPQTKIFNISKKRWIALLFLLVISTISLYYILSKSVETKNIIRNNTDDKFKEHTAQESHSRNVLSSNNQINNHQYSTPVASNQSKKNKGESAFTSKFNQQENINNRLGTSINHHNTSEVENFDIIDHLIPSETNADDIVTPAKQNNVYEQLDLASIGLDQFYFVHFNKFPETLLLLYQPSYPNWTFGISPYAAFNLYTRTKANLPQSNNEKTINSISYGIAGYVKHNGWMLKAGLNAMVMKEKTHYTDKVFSYTYDTTYSLLEKHYEITEHGKNTALIKQNIQTNADSSLVVVCDDCLTQFKYLEIPVSIQYAFGKNRVNYFVEAGFGFGILQKAAGYYTTSILSVDGKQQDFAIHLLSKSDLNPFLIRGIAQFGAKYKINHSMNIFGAAGMSYYPKSMMKNYVQKPQIKSIQLGLELGL